MSTVSIEDELEVCPSCGQAVYIASVRLTGGTRRLLPVDMVPWSGERTALRLARDEGSGWRVAPHDGPWMEHACPRPYAAQTAI